MHLYKCFFFKDRTTAVQKNRHSPIWNGTHRPVKPFDSQANRNRVPFVGIFFHVTSIPEVSTDHVQTSMSWDEDSRTWDIPLCQCHLSWEEADKLSDLQSCGLAPSIPLPLHHLVYRELCLVTKVAAVIPPQKPKNIICLEFLRQNCSQTPKC